MSQVSSTRRIFSGAALISLSGIAGRALSFFTIPILTRLLGAEPYGQAALISTVLSIAATIGMFGMDLSYARFGLEGGKTEQDSVHRFMWRWCIGSGSIAGLLAAGTWYFAKLDQPAATFPTAAFVGSMVLGTVVLNLAVAHARLSGRYGRIALASFLGAVAGMFATLTVAVWIRQDVWALLAGVVATALITLTLVGVPNARTLLKPSLLDPPQRRAVLVLGASSMATAPIYWVITSLDRWFITSYSGVHAVGVYVVAAQVGTLGFLLNSALTLTWFPEVSRAYEEGAGDRMAVIGSNANRILVGLAVVWLAITSAGGDVVRLMTASEFHEGSAYVPWIAAGTFFHGVAALFVTGLFLAKKMHLVALAWVFGGVLSVLGYAAMTPRLGPLGAAVAQSLAFAAIAVMVWALARRVLSIPLAWPRLALAALLVLTAGVLMAAEWQSSPILSLAMKMPVGVVASLLMVLIVEPGLLSRLPKLGGTQ